MGFIYIRLHFSYEGLFVLEIQLDLEYNLEILNFLFKSLKLHIYTGEVITEMCSGSASFTQRAASHLLLPLSLSFPPSAFVTDACSIDCYCCWLWDGFQRPSATCFPVLLNVFIQFRKCKCERKLLDWVGPVPSGKLLSVHQPKSAVLVQWAKCCKERQI